MNTHLQQRVIAAVLRCENTIQTTRLLLRTASPRHPKYQACPVDRRVTQQRRNASSSSSSSSRPPSSKVPLPKHTILEQPDTFRPPSHGSRLKASARSTTASYGNYGQGNYSYAGGYNQGTSEQEKAGQKSKSYPNMFPNEGTAMHWFLTNKTIHIWISLGTLTLLSIITLTQSFVKSSPFAHLLPPLTSVIFHPIDFVRETASAVRLHIDYTSEQTAEKRRQNILDAQKRRLYRRAHGMEDLSRDEGEGIDVTGLVEWDDGLTDPERRRKKEKLERERRERGGGDDDVVQVEVEGQGQGVVGGIAEGDANSATQQSQQQQPKRKVKRWLGIWE